MEEVLLLTDQTRSFQNDFEMSLLAAAEINAVVDLLDHTFVCSKHWSIYEREKSDTCVFIKILQSPKSHIPIDFGTIIYGLKAWYKY